jgi:hypothetical protein
MRDSEMQKVLTAEGILILGALGIDILIATIEAQDWISALALVVCAGIVLWIFRGLFQDFWRLDQWSPLYTHPPHQHALPAPHNLPIINLPPIEHGDFPLTSVADRPIVRANNFLLSRNFYVHVLRPLQYKITMDFPTLSMTALGVNGQSDLWVKHDVAPEKIRATFTATTRSAVDAFFAIAIDIGAGSIHAPHEKSGDEGVSYMASVTDPDGHIIEVVFRE